LADVTLHTAAEPLLGADLIAAAAGHAFIITERRSSLPAELLAQLTHVVAVLRVAVDIRNIDVDAASRAGILVTQASRSWVPAVSELAIGLMIDASRGISAANIAYKAGMPPQITMGRQLAGATAGIIGFGPLGRRVATLLVAFGMDVLAHDPYMAIDQHGVTATTLDDLLARADYVLPLAVANEETENLIDADALARMKPTAILVNLSRGNLIDEAALARALDAGRIAGAALDVGRALDQMPTPALARRTDVVATPHVGGLTPEAVLGQAEETVDQVAELIAGRMPRGAVNGKAAHRLAAWQAAHRPLQ
jgi:D-3-phosphoglycerate dehydrogenase